MKLGVLFSGGKDSVLATFLVKTQYPEHEIVCLLSMQSENEASYMFHTPNISLTSLQAEAMGIPLVVQETEGEKETELADLRKLVARAKEEYGIEGVVTGAIESVYQASRVQNVCLLENLFCFNPLWQMPQEEVLRTLLANKFEIILSAVAAYPFDESWLGRRIDEKAVEELLVLQKKYGIHAAGEGGETESLVLDCPLFKKKLEILKAHTHFHNHAGVYHITEARLQ